MKGRKKKIKVNKPILINVSSDASNKTISDLVASIHMAES